MKIQLPFLLWRSSIILMNLLPTLKKYSMNQTKEVERWDRTLVVKCIYDFFLNIWLFITLNEAMRRDLFTYEKLKQQNLNMYVYLLYITVHIVIN